MGWLDPWAAKGIMGGEGRHGRIVTV